MEAERLGAKSRFLAFVQAHVSPEYFRTEAANALRPVRGPDFVRALRMAYDIRSRNVHVLEDLPPEAWMLGERADTVSPPDMGIMLSLEGLARLSRHVIRSYVDSAPTEIDPTSRLAQQSSRDVADASRVAVLDLAGGRFRPATQSTATSRGSSRI